MLALLQSQQTEYSEDQHRYIGGFQINLVPTPWKRIEQLHFNKRVENFDNHQIEIDSFH